MKAWVVRGRGAPWDVFELADVPEPEPMQQPTRVQFWR